MGSLSNERSTTRGVESHECVERRERKRVRPVGGVGEGRSLVLVLVLVVDWALSGEEGGLSFLGLCIDMICLVCLVCLVCLICLVCLVCLVYLVRLVCLVNAPLVGDGLGSCLQKESKEGRKAVERCRHGRQ